jgi:hypothetical protein
LASANKETIRKAARELIHLQRQDGGWAQLTTVSSDAYATGQVVTALGGMAVSDPVYQRGVKFLLGTQLEDGSWFVPTRTLPVQPYFTSTRSSRTSAASSSPPPRPTGRPWPLRAWRRTRGHRIRDSVKGHAFEGLIRTVLRSVQSFTVWKNVTTTTNEIDLLVQVGLAI